MKNIGKTILIISIFTSAFFSLSTKTKAEDLVLNNEQQTTSVTTTTENTPTTTEPTIFSQTNRVTINYLNELIFDGNIITTGTNFYDDGGNNFSSTSTTALGALAAAAQQNNLPLSIKNYGNTSYYVSGIAGHTASDFDGWIYTINMADPGWVGINDYILNNNDWLTVYYSLWPWKITVNTSTITAGQNAIFTTYNYSSSAWNISPSTTISIGNEIFTTDQNGEYDYFPTATGTIKAFIYGSTDWPQNSPAVNLNIIDIIASTTTSTNETNNNGGGNNTQPYLKTDSEIQSTITAINNYIKSNEDTDGKIIDGQTTDWAAISLVAGGVLPDSKMINYIYNYNFTDSSELNLCASYPRHIMALKSLGYQNTDTRIQILSNYTISNCYKNNLYGLSGINDDIFGLIALLNIGTDSNSPIIQSIVQTIVKDQTNDGAFTWDGYKGADITGATINALKYAEANGITIDHKIYLDAKNYLKSTQLNDGGWGYDISDALTTSWVLMGINALGEDPQAWVKNDHTPYSVLINTLNDNGYYEPSYAPGTTDWFGEKHAVVGLAKKTWPINPISINYSSGSSSGADIITTSTTTTIPTSTLEITTSTLITTDTITIGLTTTLDNVKEIYLTAKPITQESKDIIEPNTKPPTVKKITKITTTTQEILDSLATTNTTALELINETPAPSQLKKYAKIILKLSGGGGVLIGLYMAFNFLKNIV